MENRIEMLNSESMKTAERPALCSNVFQNSEFGELEVMYIDDKAYFPATECAKILGYTNPRKAIIDHCKGVTKRYSLTEGGTQQKNYIPEGDLYRLITHSNLPAAEKFESWVFDDVLPAIRKQGFYSMLTDEKLLEVAFDRCLHNEEHQTLEFQLFRMQDELTMKRWEMMENVVWPKRFDHKSAQEAEQEIEDLWGADMDGAMAAKEVWTKNVCSRYGMSRIYGKWKGPKNPLAYRKRTMNYDKVIEFEIQSAKSRFRMGLPDHGHMTLRKKIAEQEEYVEQIKEIISRTDKHLAKYDFDKKGKPVESIEEGLRKEKLWNDTFEFGHRELKKFMGM